MIYLHSFLILLFFNVSMAFGGVEVPTNKQVQKMSFTRLQKLRFAYIEFLLKVDQDVRRGVSPTPKKKTTSFDIFWRNVLINHAYAITPDGNICFFGGWASRMSGGKCSSPWKNKSDSDMQRLGAYGSETACGDSNKFRCNPVLFGSPAEDEKGLCVEINGTYDHLTEKCEVASRDLVPQITESYQKDPSRLVALSEEIKTFCDSYESYDACDDLAKRINEIAKSGVRNYSGSGVRPTGSEAKEDEKLPPVAHLAARSPGHGAEVINRCQELLKNKSDVKQRNILSYLESKECSAEIANTFSTLDDFEKIAEVVDSKEAVKAVNVKAFEQNMMAIMSNEIKFGSRDLNFKSKDELFAQLLKDYPELLKSEEYQKAFNVAYQNVDKEVRAGHLFPVDLESTRQQFNHLSMAVNEACGKIRDRYQSKFNDPGFFSRMFDGQNHKAFYASQLKGIHDEMNVLLNEAVVGHLMSTNHFKQNVFDPSEDIVEECARNPSFQLIKNPVPTSIIAEGHNEIREMLNEGLSSINNRAQVINSNDKDDIDEVLEDYLKNDPSIVNLAMEEMDSTNQQHLGALICKATDNILSSDKRWKYFDAGVGVIGAGAGLVLMATGVGSPLGLALTTKSLLLTATTIGMARSYNQYQSAEVRIKANNIALAERRQKMQEYLKQSGNASYEKRQAIGQGGLAVVSAIIPLKVFSLVKPSKLLPKFSFFKRTPAASVAAEGAKKSRFSLKKIALVGIGIWAAGKTWDALTTEEQEELETNLGGIFEQYGAKLPSEVIGTKNISSLSLDESYMLLEQMAGSPLDQDKIDQLMALVSAESYEGQPQSFVDLLNIEAGKFMELGNHIQMLQASVEEPQASVE